MHTHEKGSVMTDQDTFQELPAPPAEVPEVLPFNRHAEAGRLGARRVHQLIRLGKLFEEEHGLKRGRQRLRQLIQQGRRYEIEHGLVKPRRARPRRGEAWADFLAALARVVKPAYRAEVERLAAVMTARPADGEPA
jgi:hypothetical protein